MFSKCARQDSAAGGLRPSSLLSRKTSVVFEPRSRPLETFLAHAADSDPLAYAIPACVERDFRAYLRCGILAHGFARARCGDCGHERLIAFSCKGRGICPPCNTRRMAEVAAHLTDHGLPHLPVRQWVLSLPKRLRPYLHHNPDIAGAVLRIFLRAIRTTLRSASPGAPPHPQLGAVSFLHRFGSALNPHFHFHLVVVDGVFAQVPDGTVRFHEATLLDERHWLDLQRVLQRRVLRHFRTRGPPPDSPPATPRPLSFAAPHLPHPPTAPYRPFGPLRAVELAILAPTCG